MSSVVVVGGGVAGLTCAWRLQRAGHDVEVLERESSPGGRMRSRRHEGFVLEGATAQLRSRSHNLHGIALAIGIGAAFQPLSGERRALLRNGRWLGWEWGWDLAAIRALSPTGDRGRRAFSGALQIAQELYRHRGELDPLHPEAAATLDGENAAGFIEGILGRELRDEWAQPLLFGLFGCEADHLSSAALLLSLRAAGLRPRPELCEGGSGRFSTAIAAKLPVRADCEVLSVETESEGARVRYRVRGRERRVLADAVVVAVPGVEVPGLCPKLTPTERGFFECVHYTVGSHVHLMLERAPGSLPFYAVDFPRGQGFEVGTLWADHLRPGAAPAGAGLLRVQLTEAGSRSLWEAGEPRVVERVLENLERTPLGRLAPVESNLERFVHGSTQFYPGYLRQLAAFSRSVDRSPRMAFAGDYLVEAGAEGAVTSGMRASSEIIRSLA